MYCLSTRAAPRSTLFPYTTLFRSIAEEIVNRSRVLGFRQRPKTALRDGRVLFLRAVLAALVGRLAARLGLIEAVAGRDRKSTRLNSSHMSISYAIFCLKKKKTSVI